MPARRDRAIPALVSLTRGAAIAGVSTQQMSVWVAGGRLGGVKVGRQTLVVRAEVRAFAKARRAGRAAPARRKAWDVTALVSPAAAGRILNRSARWVRELYARGDLPGARVGKDIVFREEVVRAEAVMWSLQGRVDG